MESLRLALDALFQNSALETLRGYGVKPYREKVSSVPGEALQYKKSSFINLSCRSFSGDGSATSLTPAAEGDECRA